MLKWVLANTVLNLMFIGPCIIVMTEAWKTNLMSLAILFHFLCAQHVSHLDISIIRSLRLCWWITSVVLFSVRCGLELLVPLVLGGVRFAGLMMDILRSETCWAQKKWNKIASDIKLVFHASTVLNVFIQKTQEYSDKSNTRGCPKISQNLLVITQILTFKS